VQSISQLLEMLRRGPHLFRHPGHSQRSVRHLLSIAQVEFRLASRPPGTPRRAVIHPLPDLLIRPSPQQLHQGLNPRGSLHFLARSSFRSLQILSEYWHPSQPSTHLPPSSDSQGSLPHSALSPNRAGVMALPPARQATPPPTLSTPWKPSQLMWKRAHSRSLPGRSRWVQPSAPRALPCVFLCAPRVLFGKRS
jgi:hypothetical protein